MVIRWPWDNWEITGTYTASHRAVYVPAVMRGQFIPYEYSMKVCAWDIVYLSIRPQVVAKITEYIGGGGMVHA